MARYSLAAAFLVALVLIGTPVAMKRLPALQPDEPNFISIAVDLVETGTFTDGSMSPKPAPRPAGRFFAPAYPLLLAGVAKLSPSVHATLSCYLDKPKAERATCGSIAPVLAMQVVLAALGMAAVFAIALMLSGVPAVAWTAMLLTIASGEPTYYARLLLSETTAFAGFYLALVALVWLAVSGRLVAAAGAGAALGIAILSRPSYLYLFYALIAVLVVTTVWGRRRPSQKGEVTVTLSHAALFAIAGFAVMLPWHLRNLAQFGDTAITAGYASFTLVQRVAYNAMTWKEWAIAWIFWFPDIGDDIAKTLFKPENWQRLRFTTPDSFYKVGVGPFSRETVAAAGGEEKHLGYLMRHYVIGDLFKQVAVTFPLAWRGMFPGKWIAVAGLLLLWPATRRMIHAGKILPFLALALPLLFMLGLHAFASVNVARYNVPMLALYTFAIALIGHEWILRRLPNLAASRSSPHGHS